jgi:hypothetical protein
MQINVNKNLSVLLDAMASNFNSTDEMFNFLLEKSLRLTEVKRLWIKGLLDQGMTESQVVMRGVGNPSGDFGIRNICREISKES